MGFPGGQCTVSSGRSCPGLVRGTFWRVLTNGVATTATTFARHEPNRAFMGRGGEVHSHPKSCTYKYQGAVGGYPDGMDGSTSLQRSSIHLWNRCHVELLQFAELKRVLHDTLYLSHDFWHFSVYRVLVICMSVLYTVNEVLYF
ncbi:hypothetical protein B7P43_G18110 [Cryptotermes secundus]|uniref:Uncharacterized protein n=1 Tax=Cryptotermes secundus TaxID=105785 RepID=A0A2J7R6A6_9NEOP|nr:hypothetical protein B7P43_G18110 [Cryptotermes secundus]